ncbi:putative quinol monooxygenase [Sphingomonas aliaeris]|nr:antibiotic biosynthesis monooxygenase [Sphingomonas aliaeris]
MRKILMAISSMILSLSATEAIAANASPMVRIAEIEVDPDQLAAYKAILAEEQEASVRLEPGVLMLHSVAIAAQPNQIRLLEVYADRAAYEAHIRSSHFVKYKTSTERMVRSLKLIETTPILLCAKAAADSKSLVPTCR